MAGLVCHMRDIHCLSCLMPVGSYTEEACLSKGKADPRGSYTPREPGDAGAGGIPSRGPQPLRRSWTVERLVFEKDILRRTLGPSRNSLQGIDCIGSHEVAPLGCLHKAPYKG